MLDEASGEARRSSVGPRARRRRDPELRPTLAPLVPQNRAWQKEAVTAAWASLVAWRLRLGLPSPCDFGLNASSRSAPRIAASPSPMIWKMYSGSRMPPANGRHAQPRRARWTTSSPNAPRRPSRQLTLVKASSKPLNPSHILGQGWPTCQSRLASRKRAEGPPMYTRCMTTSPASSPARCRARHAVVIYDARCELEAVLQPRAAGEADADRPPLRRTSPEVSAKLFQTVNGPAVAGSARRVEPR